MFCFSINVINDFSHNVHYFSSNASLHLSFLQGYDAASSHDVSWLRHDQIRTRLFPDNRGRVPEGHDRSDPLPCLPSDGLCQTLQRLGTRGVQSGPQKCEIVRDGSRLLCTCNDIMYSIHDALWSIVSNLQHMRCELISRLIVPSDFSSKHFRTRPLQQILVYSRATQQKQ
jgi:hypothetical protein